MSKKSDEVQPIIVKKIKKGGGGHHGGAWKVAYADFVTAMMAFFLLLWLLNIATKEQLNAISTYFDPSHPQISDSTSGAGGLLGGLSVTPEGAMTDNRQPMTQQQETGRASSGQASEQKALSTYEEEVETAQMESRLRAREDERFEDVKKDIEDAIRQSPALEELAKNVQIDVTPEGLRIQILDQEGKPMFPSGSAEMYEKTRALMAKVGELIKTQPNKVSVRGHTDAHQYGPSARYTNWELSADRANASRRVLQQSGIKPERVANVMGKADTEHFIADKPLDARNRRISIILEREPLKDAIARGEFGNMPVPRTLQRPKEQADPLPGVHGKPKDDFRKTQGEVYFP